MPVDVVAVHPVDAGLEQRVEDALVLGVPAEAEHAEPVEQRGEPTASTRCGGG